MEGYYMEQNDSVLWILKINYKYYDHFNGQIYIYKTEQFRNGVTDRIENKK